MESANQAECDRWPRIRADSRPGLWRSANEQDAAQELQEVLKGVSGGADPTPIDGLGNEAYVVEGVVEVRVGDVGVQLQAVLTDGQALDLRENDVIEMAKVAISRLG